MSWLFSRALVEAFSGGRSSVGEPCAQLNVMDTPHRFWRNDKMMEPSLHSRFGLTCAALTADRGEELLTSFRAAFPVRTSALPGEGPGSVVPAQDSGARWPASWAKFDHNTSTWRTHQFSLLGGLELFSATWPRSGLMRHGECYPLKTLEHRTSANASGSWPTPCTPNGGRVNKATDIATKGQRPDGRKVQISLESAAKSWGTPIANDGVKNGAISSDPRNRLAGQAKAWGTPTTRDHKDSGNCSNVPENGLLGRMAKSFAGKTASPGSLSPEFHLWLMGWPTGWTALEPLEMDKYHLWLQRHGVS